MKYTNKEIEYLKKNYCKEHKSFMLTFLKGHSWSSIKDKAKKLKLSRPNIRTKKLRILLENNVINAYWWGFIMSDGYISERGYLKIHLNVKDELHLKQLSDYLDCKINHIYDLCTLEVMDMINGLSLKEKLGITQKKTYNPPSGFKFLKSSRERLSFLIGFIDGDGCITFRKKHFRSIRIVVHGNWIHFFEEFCNKLSKDYNLKFTVTKNSRGNASIYFGRNESYNLVKCFIEKNNIPKMKRKWL